MKKASKRHINLKSSRFHYLSCNYSCDNCFRSGWNENADRFIFLWSGRNATDRNFPSSFRIAFLTWSETPHARGIARSTPGTFFCFCRFNWYTFRFRSVQSPNGNSSKSKEGKISAKQCSVATLECGSFFVNSPSSQFDTANREMM